MTFNDDMPRGSGFPKLLWNGNTKLRIYFYAIYFSNDLNETTEPSMVILSLVKHNDIGSTTRGPYIALD